MSNLSPRALALCQAHGPLPIDWERVAAVVEGMVAEQAKQLTLARDVITEARRFLVALADDGGIKRTDAMLKKTLASYDETLARIDGAIGTPADREEIANG